MREWSVEELTAQAGRMGIKPTTPVAVDSELEALKTRASALGLAPQPSPIADYSAGLANFGRQAVSDFGESPSPAIPQILPPSAAKLDETKPEPNFLNAAYHAVVGPLWRSLTTLGQAVPPDPTDRFGMKLPKWLDLHRAAQTAYVKEVGAEEAAVARYPVLGILGSIPVAALKVAPYMVLGPLGPLYGAAEAGLEERAAQEKQGINDTGTVYEAAARNALFIGALGKMGSLFKTPAQKMVGIPAVFGATTALEQDWQTNPALAAQNTLASVASGLVMEMGGMLLDRPNRAEIAPAATEHLRNITRDYVNVTFDQRRADVVAEMRKATGANAMTLEARGQFDTELGNIEKDRAKALTSVPRIAGEAISSIPERGKVDIPGFAKSYRAAVDQAIAGKSGPVAWQTAAALPAPEAPEPAAKPAPTAKPAAAATPAGVGEAAEPSVGETPKPAADAPRVKPAASNEVLSEQEQAKRILVERRRAKAAVSPEPPVSPPAVTPPKLTPPASQGAEGKQADSRQIVANDVAKDVGEDYRAEHKAPDAESGAPLSQMDKGMYPSDLYSADGARLYGDHVADARDHALHNLILKVRGNPDAEVTVYRGVPADAPATINPGDWVTPDRKYAADHAARYGKYHVAKLRVKAGELFTEGNSLYEYGYQPAKSGAAPAPGQPPSQPTGEPKTTEPAAPKVETKRGGRKPPTYSQAKLYDKKVGIANGAKHPEYFDLASIVDNLNLGNHISPKAMYDWAIERGYTAEDVAKAGKDTEESAKVVGNAVLNRSTIEESRQAIAERAKETAAEVPPQGVEPTRWKQAVDEATQRVADIEQDDLLYTQDQVDAAHAAIADVAKKHGVGENILRRAVLYEKVTPEPTERDNDIMQPGRYDRLKKDLFGEPKPMTAAIPEIPAYTRTTPVQGTPEREAIDAKAKAANDAESAAFTAASDLRHKVNNAGVGTKVRDKLAAQHDKADKAASALLDANRAVHQEKLTAVNEDYLATGDEWQRTIAAERLKLIDSKTADARMTALAEAEARKQGATDKELPKVVNEASSRFMTSLSDGLAKTIEVSLAKVRAPELKAAVEREIDGLEHLTQSEKEKFKRDLNEYASIWPKDIQKYAERARAANDAVTPEVKEQRVKAKADEQAAAEYEANSSRRVAESLVPPVKDGKPTISANIREWGGSVSDEPGRFVSDGHILFDAEAIGKSADLDKMAAKPQAGRENHPPQKLMLSLWSKAVKAAKTKAKAWGHYDPREGSIVSNAHGYLPRFMVLSAGDNVHILSADKYALVQRVTKFDEIRAPKDPLEPVIMYRDGKPVAMLMPIRPDGTTTVADLEAAAGKAPAPKPGGEPSETKPGASEMLSAARRPADAVDFAGSPASENPAIQAAVAKLSEVLAQHDIDHEVNYSPTRRTLNPADPDDRAVLEGSFYSAKELNDDAAAGIVHDVGASCVSDVTPEGKRWASVTITPDGTANDVAHELGHILDTQGIVDRGELSPEQFAREFAAGVAANGWEPTIEKYAARPPNAPVRGQGELFAARDLRALTDEELEKIARGEEPPVPAAGFEHVGTSRTTEPITFEKQPSEMTDEELEKANALDAQRTADEKAKFVKEQAARLADMTPKELAGLNKWSAGMTAPDVAREFMHWADEADRFTGTGQESAFSRLAYRARLDYGVKSLKDLTPEQWEHMRKVSKAIALHLREGERNISWLGRAAKPDTPLEELEKRATAMEDNLLKRIGAIKWPWNSFTAELGKKGGEFGKRLASMLDGYHYGTVSYASENRAIFNDAVKPMLAEFRRSADLFGRKRQKALNIVFAYGEGVMPVDEAIAEIKAQTGKVVDAKTLDTIHQGMTYLFSVIKGEASRLGIDLKLESKTYFPHTTATPDTPKWQRNWEQSFWDKRLADPHDKAFMHRYYDLLDKGVDPHGDENFIEYAQAYAKHRLSRLAPGTGTLEGMPEEPDKRAAKLVAAWGFAAKDPAWLPIYAHFQSRAEVPFPFWSYGTDAALNYIDGTARYLAAVSYLGEPPTSNAMPPYLAELLQGVLERDHNFGRKAADYIRNVILHPPPLDYEWWDKAVDALNTYEMIRLGPTFTVKNILQGVVNNPEYNLADWAVGMGKLAQLAWEMASRAETHGRSFRTVDFVREAATVSEMQTLEVMGLQGRGPIGAVIDAHYKLIGGSLSEAINRAVSTVLVPHKAEKFARRLTAVSEGKGKWLWRYRQGAYRDYFRQMGIEPEEVVARGFIRPEDLARVAHGANRLSQFLATAKDVPRWWGSIPGNATQRALKRALLMFQRFNYLQAAKVSRLASDSALFIRTGGKRGNVGSLIAFSVMAYVTTLLAREVLNKIKGRRNDWEKLVPRSQVAKLFTLMQYTGHYGVWLDAMQMAVIGDKAFDFSTGPVTQELADLSKLLGGIREDVSKGQSKDIPQEFVDWGLSRTSTLGVIARLASPAAQRRATVFDYSVTARELYKAYGALWRGQGDKAAQAWWDSPPVKEFRDRYQKFSGKVLTVPSDKAMKARVEGEQVPSWERVENALPGVEPKTPSGPVRQPKRINMFQRSDERKKAGGKSMFQKR